MQVLKLAQDLGSLQRQLAQDQAAQLSHQKVSPRDGHQLILHTLSLTGMATLEFVSCLHLGPLPTFSQPSKLIMSCYK